MCDAASPTVSARLGACPALWTFLVVTRVPPSTPAGGLALGLGMKSRLQGQDFTAWQSMLGVLLWVEGKRSLVPAEAYRGCAGNMGWGFVQFDTVEAAERATQLTDVNLMGRDLFINAATTRAPELPSGEPVAGCWFCLSSETADLHLVVSIGSSSQSPQPLLHS